MKIFLYALLSIILFAVAAGTYFYFNFLKTPKLRINEGENKIEAIDKWLAKLQSKNQFNGAVLMTKNDEILLMKGYGYTNHLQNETITPQSSFRLASVSKQFTATGIMLLHEKGLLNYDTTVSTYIKDFPYENVTVRHLLHHTSGVPDVYMSLAKKHKDEIGDILSIQKVIQLVNKYPKEVKAQPNDKFVYSNTGYVLLAGIIENISGQSFEMFMQEALFEPMDMKNSRIWNLLSEDATFPNKTTGFAPHDNNKEVKPNFLDGVAGDGAVFSSLEDFLIWDKFWYENNLISSENLQEAFQPVTLNDGSVSNYGFGWGINGHKVAHEGGWMAARTLIARNRETKTCLVILENSSNLRFNGIVKELGKGLQD